MSRERKELTVLVVDDSPFARRTVGVCLNAAGLGDARIEEAEHGAAALQKLKTRAADLVVTDLNMPVMDGRTLLRRMRASPRLHRVPVIVVSSVVTPAASRKLGEDGANAVVAKPLTGPKALAAISAVLEEVAA